MADDVRRIGLSLGADLCWPLCFEKLLERLDLSVPMDGDTLRFEVERVTIEPYRLRQPTKYDVVLDRLAHWFYTSREWVKKAILMDDVYVFNNPWTFQAMEKQTSYCAMMRLGLPVPETWMVPPKEYEPVDDLQPTLQRYAQLFDVAGLGQQVGYPLFMKPYDGGAWRGVTRIDDDGQLRAAYEQSGKLVMHLQSAVHPYEHFVRCVGVGPQFRVMLYDPSAPLHARYMLGEIPEEDQKLIRDMTMTINSFFGWDFNSCEALSKDGSWHPIDFANACPDSQVTSLHYHFPWLVKSKLSWALFNAATRRRMRLNCDWDPFFEIAAKEPDMPLRERLAAYAAIGHERMETERFEEFCSEHLGHLDEVALEFFQGDEAHDAVRQKVAALFPPHEVEDFTKHFWDHVQQWCKDEKEGKSEGGAS